jgi:hypothetical protein
MELQLTLLLWSELHPSLNSVLNKILEWHYDMSETCQIILGGFITLAYMNHWNIVFQTVCEHVI